MAELSGEKVERMLRRLTSLPSLPSAVDRLVRLGDAEATPRQYAEIISTDQGLTAKVLKLVNSAFYGLSRPISSLDHASTLLGTKTLRSLVLSASLLRLCRHDCEGFTPLEFWRHSIGVAVAGRRIARAVLPEREDDLYVAGLLHDTGIVLLAQNLPREYDFVLRTVRETGKPLAEVEREYLSTTHAEIGYSQVTQWRLSSEICDCIRYHDFSPEELPASLRAGPTRAVVEVLRLAEAVVRRAGYGFFEGGADSEDDAIDLDPDFPLDLPALLEAAGDIGVEIARLEELVGASEAPS